ncbi:hypothetical protein [Planktotalea sp.]|uniref:hypothetical protein n=1 Tax=Planktotalea sp. TaxID=2029877 RepID=UPI0035C79B61
MTHTADNIDWHDSLLSRSFLWVKVAATLYVVGISISHFVLPHSYIWSIALFFLIAMLFTYPAAALRSGSHFTLEARVAALLALIGCVGFVTSPWLIIVGIFGHGVWDLMKHRGHGTPFFGWYVSGCVVVDWCYAAALTFFLLTGPI